MKQARTAFRKLRWATLLLSTIYRGYAARKEADKLRLIRDATIYIYFHLRRYLKRRRARLGREHAELGIKQEMAKRMEGVLAARRLQMRRQNTCTF